MVVLMPSSGAVLAIDPAGIAVLVVLLLPDRHAVLDLIDDVAAGIECLTAMRRADADPDRKLADRERPDAVRTAHVLEPESLTRLLQNALALAQRQRSERLVLEPQHPPALVVVAYPAFKRDVAAAGRIAQLPRAARSGRMRRVMTG